MLPPSIRYGVLTPDHSAVENLDLFVTLFGLPRDAPSDSFLLPDVIPVMHDSNSCIDQDRVMDYSMHSDTYIRKPMFPSAGQSAAPYACLEIKPFDYRRVSRGSQA